MSSSSRFVRASRFRHVFAETVKPEGHYMDLELSPVTGDHSYIKGNSKFFSIAVRGGGGPVQVIPYSLTGKIPRSYPALTGHSAAVYDTAWNPFNENVLATGSDDTTVKLWEIPDAGLSENMKDCLVTLSGHGKPVSLLQWHPTANGVLASAGKDPAVKIWDVEKASAKVSLEGGFGGLVQDMAWNYDGSLLITSTKDKLAKIHDVRANTVAAEWTPHEGGKAFKTLFLGERGQILTVGFTKQSKREFKIWDGKNFSEPLATQEVDQAAGVMLPFYDDDTRMLYLTGKGDGNIRYYELVDEAPHIYFLSEHRTNVSTKGADMLPKRACNVMRCEVARILKLTSDSVEPISFIVPRKSEAFQEDIFPDTAAGVPSHNADAWFGGKNAAPKKVSLDPAKGGAVHAAAPTALKPVVAHTPTPTPSGGSSASSAAPVASGASSHPTPVAAAGAGSAGADSGKVSALESEVAALKKQLAAANERIHELEASEAKLKKAVAALSS